jgi:quercetin dioxygenase-like cupin family protein
MATHHATPNEIVDLQTWANDLPVEKSKVIVKTREMELARLVLLAGQEFREHQVTGPITVHCIKGEVEFSAMESTQKLTAGQLLYLEQGQPHALKATSDSIILLTIVFID